MIKKIYKMILKSPHKKQLLPAFSLILLAAGCGKKLSNTGADGDNVVQKPGLNSGLISLNVHFGPKNSLSKFVYELKDSGTVKIPEKIYTTFGIPESYVSKLTFNKGNSLEEFYCKYENILDKFNQQQVTYINKFKGCFQDTQHDSDMSNDDELNYIPFQEIPHNKGEKIVLELLSFKTKTDSMAKAEVDIEWF